MSEIFYAVRENERSDHIVHDTPDHNQPAYDHMKLLTG